MNTKRCLFKSSFSFFITAYWSGVGTKFSPNTLLKYSSVLWLNFRALHKGNILWSNARALFWRYSYFVVSTVLSFGNRWKSRWLLPSQSAMISKPDRMMRLWNGKTVRGIRKTDLSSFSSASTSSINAQTSSKHRKCSVLTLSMEFALWMPWW